MRTTKPITVSLPGDLLREAQRVAREDARGRSELIREALRDYLASRRWQRLRRWGAETAERLGLKSEEDLQRLLDQIRDCQAIWSELREVLKETQGNLWVDDPGFGRHWPRSTPWRAA